MTPALTMDDGRLTMGAGEWRRRLIRAGRTGLKAVPTSGMAVGGLWLLVLGRLDDGRWVRGMAPACVSGGADGPKGRPYVRKWRLLVCGCWFLDE